MTLEKATIMLHRICPPNVACQANPFCFLPFYYYLPESHTN